MHKAMMILREDLWCIGGSREGGGRGRKEGESGWMERRMENNIE